MCKLVSAHAHCSFRLVRLLLLPPQWVSIAARHWLSVCRYTIFSKQRITKKCLHLGDGNEKGLFRGQDRQIPALSRHSFRPFGLLRNARVLQGHFTVVRVYLALQSLEKFVVVIWRRAEFRFRIDPLRRWAWIVSRWCLFGVVSGSRRFFGLSTRLRSISRPAGPSTFYTAIQHLQPTRKPLRGRYPR